jgi:hypothetical protein
VEQQPELIGQEAMATQSIGLELQLQFLDAVFHIAPEHGEVVIDELGAAPQVGDHKALIGAQMGVFHLGEEAAGVVPGFRLVPEGGKEALVFSRLLVLPLGLFQKRGGLFQDPVVGDKTDDVADLVLLLQIVVKLGHGQTATGP